MATTFYDVTTFQGSTSPYQDIGAVINEIIADIKAFQTTQTTRPGAVIYIPPGHYDLLTRVVIDISFLQIKGAGHGFLSQAIRDDTVDTSRWEEVLPGGSHIRVLNTDGNREAFLVYRTGSPELYGRLNSIVFQDFCLNGVSAEKPYSNGKIGISVQSDNDSLRIEGMGLMYLERPLLIHGADAISITNNFITETGSCIELTAGSILGKITNNYLISAWAGYSIFVENGEGLLVAGNTIVWAGKIYLSNVSRGNISSNKILSNFPGMVILTGDSKENLISSNHFRRTWGDGTSDLLDDSYGLIRVEGSGNQISSNIFAFDVPSEQLLPEGAVPAIIRITMGDNNYLGMNQIVANLPVAVVLDAPTTTTKILYSATEDQFSPATTSYSFIPTPGANNPSDFIRYDEIDSRIVYSGQWTQTSGPNYYGGTEHHTFQVDAMATFSFNGTAFKIIASTGPQLTGQLDVIVDGTAIGSCDFNSTGYLYQQAVFQSPQFNGGVHNVQLIQRNNGYSHLDALDIQGDLR